MNFEEIRLCPTCKKRLHKSEFYRDRIQCRRCVIKKQKKQQREKETLMEFKREFCGWNGDHGIYC